MIVLKTEDYLEWFNTLRDLAAKKKIVQRLARVEIGNFGDAAPVGEGVSELRIHFGSGYRIYLTHRQKITVILLCGGDKKTQNADIIKAKAMAKKVWEQYS